MGKPILYSYFRSSCSYRVRIALNLKGIEYEYRPIHLVKDGGEQKSKDFQKLNPKEEVPFFEDGEFGLSQSMAIINYIDKKWENPPLFPKEIKANSVCIQLCEIINTGIQPIQNLKVMKEVVTRYNQEDSEKVKWGKFWIEEGFNALEKMLQRTSGIYSLGDEVTAADLFLVPQTYNANRFKLNMDDYPCIKKVNENCLKLEAFKQAEPSVQPDAPKE